MSIILLDSSSSRVGSLPVSGAKIWLRAQGLSTGTTNSYGTVDGSGEVTQWTDLTGNGNHATYVGGTGTAPSLNGTNGTNSKQGITFDGLLDNLQIANKTLLNNKAGATVFVVCKATSIKAATENEVFFFSANGSDNGRFSLSIDDASNRWRTRCRRLDAYVYADSHQILGSLDVTSSKVMAVNANFATGLGIMYEDGEIKNWEANLNITAGNTSATDSTFASIGNLINAGNYPFHGVISEIVFYDRALTIGECDSVNAFLQSYYGIASPSDYATDPITTAWLAATGTTPSANWVTKFNNFWAKQRANGNLAALDRLGIMQTETSAEAIIDCVDPTKTLTLVNSPTFTPLKGYTGNGTNQLIRTSTALSALTQYTQNSAIAFAYTGTNTGVTGVSIGCKDAANVTKIYPKYTDNKMYVGINEVTGTHANIANYSAFGIAYVERTASGTQRLGINNDQLTTGGQASTIRPTVAPYLLGQNANGTDAEWYAGQIRMWGLGSSVVDIEALVVDYKTFEAGIGIYA